ncbi:Uma2 family endonuclease [Leucothrix pacifica]|uniref:Uma2 family endonuclease n=1 Tax=Leucothrix pacifica TaxID=1247513 RepID=A0A317CHK8_9GAMM|nr:Uma2 family endonuclease [Leucothrix pacifica]PWQ98038.1 Uma2 family endonuclease [Leucothrix pacifica]
MQAIKSDIGREEYLEYDHASELKHEFYKGEIFAMSGGTFSHAKISLNIATSLQNQLRGKPCEPMNSDMRVHTPSGLDTYPDISVFCGEPELTDKDRTLNNPSVIIEVLSPSTRNYDRGDKFWHYRSITSLQDFLLVDSESVYIEHYSRQNKDEWLLHEYREPDATISLGSLELELSVAELYEGVNIKQ